MPKYEKVQESKSMTVKLSEDQYWWVKRQASSRRIPPAQLISEMIENAIMDGQHPLLPALAATDGGGSISHKPIKAAPRTSKPASKTTDSRPSKDERIALYREFKAAVDATGMSRLEAAQAIDPKFVNASNYDSWKDAGIPSKYVDAARAFIAAQKERQHEEV